MPGVAGTADASAPVLAALPGATAGGATQAGVADLSGVALAAGPTAAVVAALEAIAGIVHTFTLNALTVAPCAGAAGEPGQVRVAALQPAAGIGQQLGVALGRVAAELSN